MVNGKIDIKVHNGHVAFYGLKITDTSYKFDDITDMSQIQAMMTLLRDHKYRKSAYCTPNDVLTKKEIFIRDPNGSNVMFDNLLDYASGSIAPEDEFGLHTKLLGHLTKGARSVINKTNANGWELNFNSSYMEVKIRFEVEPEDVEGELVDVNELAYETRSIANAIDNAEKRIESKEMAKGRHWDIDNLRRCEPKSEVNNLAEAINLLEQGLAKLKAQS